MKSIAVNICTGISGGPWEKDLKISTRFSPFGDYLPFKKCFVHFIFNDLESSLYKDDPVDQEK